MLQLDLTPDLEAQLASEAQARGLSTERYAEDLLASAFHEDDGLSEGLADIAAGRSRPAHEVFAELHERYGIRG